MEMTSIILHNHSNIVVFYVLTYIASMKFIISSFLLFLIRYILWITEHYWLLCRLLKSLLLYSDVNTFFTFHIIFPDSFFRGHSAEEPVMPLIHKQWITNDCWIPSALVLVVSFLLGVMLCSSERRMTGQLVMDRSDPWCSNSTVIFSSAFVSYYCWIF